MWHVYIVECSDGLLYTGSTTDVSRRVAEHNEGKRGAKFTRGRRPVRLVWTLPCGSQGQALGIEARIKGMRRFEKLALIAGKAP